ncbi:tyrosine-protein kinase JAK1 isoform X2 [Salmo salar]|uniref:Tyrosine-protein kinase n=1 Tax=Salmo salar TaxID=8030 RepID=A0ABM3EHD7_SALSA|nr:tyrosine-protein kinase JAK1 isoform X3 [Salmo salar]XP_045570449.1 tyrosine-protein kinase JAK1 isoform X1 [Salmo salar]XP_045570450.1 tyrosine-protein kinase JAK1 isoform X1 [Salmo salar]XP_045570451.1 tyrosine-protein kinase JAK1 isoform X2 [Salmo salar]
MEVGRQLLVKMRMKRKGEFTSVPVIVQGLKVHFYLEDSPQLEFLHGCYTAEELCTNAAKKCGISPLCCNLFALYDEVRKIWFPPNHTFKESSHLKLHYRMRFYFTNWHGVNESVPRVCRHALKRKNANGPKTEPEGNPLLDTASLKYLFAQGQHDFLKGWATLRNPQNEEEVHYIENECLGMAVLSISHHALDNNIVIPGVAGQISYKKYIPDRVNQIIKQRNFLTRLRISRVFQDFLNDFNNKTVQSDNVSTHDIKVKYLATLETLTCGFGCEEYEPKVLRVTDSEGEIQGTPTSCNQGQPTQYQVLVSGNTGIKWRRKQQNVSNAWTAKEKNKSPKHKTNINWTNKPPQGVSNDWKTFSDFHEITHINIKGSTVTVHKQDNKKMELSLGFHAEALSFAALIDGYFRLTVDAHHFLCTDVAPPSVVRNLQEGCHGPIGMDYTSHKLRQEGEEEGMYVLRWSCINYDHILLTVTGNEVDLTNSRLYRSFKIEVGPEGYSLNGTDLRQPSLRELMEQLRGQTLSTDRVTFQLRKACPPQPREISNLLFVTKREAEPTHPIQSQLIFHRILKEDILQEEHLGCGTRTNIYAGKLKIKCEEEKDVWGSQTHHQVKVVLKVLWSQHRDISMAFFETVSMIHQLSHQHIALLHGVCVRNQDNIIVEEHVKLGPLDVFMKGCRLQLSTSWKFQVAKQLASVLSYLEDKKLVHGYVSAKNILVERDGLEGETGPFIKLSSPGVPISALNRQECVERIPWIAPECVRDNQVLSVAVDKWGFGTTLWEICYDGEAPLKDKKLIEKEMFYSAQCSLVTPDCPQLGELITKCMTYDPKRRPFFRAIVRDLTGVAEQNPALPPGRVPIQEVDPTVFETRFLRKIKDLGEGHFGKVELCQYDPRGDGRGQLVAVKSLKPESRGQLWREIDTMRELYHHNIVKYRGVCSEEGGRTTKLIMEYLPAGSLKDYLPWRKHQTDLKRLLHYALQICQGMDYLGSQRFIHRDLAARNVLVENESTVKIGDFGLTKSMKEDKSYYTVKEETDSPVFWYAPECLVDCKFYPASDVWSFGVTLYELLTYCETSSSPTTVFLEMLRLTQGQMIITRLVEVLMAGRRLPCPPHCPDAVYSLMRRCWESSPENRIQFKDLITELKLLLDERHGGDGLAV